MLPLIIYALGFMVTWLIATVHWINEFQDDTPSEIMMGAAWGMLSAILWPLMIPLLIVGYIAKHIVELGKP